MICYIMPTMDSDMWHLFPLMTIFGRELLLCWLIEEPKEFGIYKDNDLMLLTRALRAFHRTTGVNGEIFLRRLGKQGHHFIDVIVPDALEAGLLEEVPYRGSGNHRRFRLKVQMSQVQSSLRASQGNYEKFLKTIAGK
ncbi:hypothetical protein P4E94_18410 [Pontiellaceae bacterium B12219]|nr:hypothetical protein [Pontiellaceae bacterium B12219]